MTNIIIALATVAAMTLATSAYAKLNQAEISIEARHRLDQMVEQGMSKRGAAAALSEGANQAIRECRDNARAGVRRADGDPLPCDELEGLIQDTISDWLRGRRP